MSSAEGREREGAELLSIDPGTSRLAFSHVEWNGSNPEDVSNYAVHWACVVDLCADRSAYATLQRQKDAIEDDDRNEIDIVIDDESTTTASAKEWYNSTLNQLENLGTFLEENQGLNAIVDEAKRNDRPNGKTLEVAIEQTEGVRDINVMFTLMRVNMVSGYLFHYFRTKGLKVNLVPKNFKLGWSSLTGIAKRKTATRTTGATNKKTASAENRKWRKQATCYLIGHAIEKGFSSEETKTAFKACKNLGKLNHVADSASQALRFMMNRHRTVATTPPGSKGTTRRSTVKSSGSTLNKEVINQIEDKLFLRK